MQKFNNQEKEKTDNLSHQSSPTRKISDNDYLKLSKRAFLSDSKDDVRERIDKGFFSKEKRVKSCKEALEVYFHPEDKELTERFAVVYDIFNLNDTILSNKVGVDRTTLSRYRRGIWRPSTDMKRIISQTIAKISDCPFDSTILFGDSVYFDEFKDGVKENE